VQRDYYQRLAELFDATVEQPDELRDAFAERSCEGDTQLLRELRAMLDADRREQPLLDRPLSLPEAAFDTAEAVVGERIGAFRLVRRIGDGGMGTVWLAERSEGGFEQRVALKRVRHELDTPGSRQRFGQERRILAALEHPAIARLLDGGFDARGAPWFAMEYVDGETLLHYARGNALDLRARVGLLRDICFAVAYAHGRLVVHRDLKPANILVTRDGSVKLLDFGTAGMLEAGRGTSAKDETALPRGVVMATPDYAAPEQLRSGDITTATDVYALGVILYELLTDALPYTLVTRMPEAMAEELRGISPVPPSQRAPDAWARRLCGDFDAIAAKAMAFNPVDRYVSAEALAADLVAALDDRPVAARPLGRAARARKFVRRHRLGAAMSVATLLILAVGVAGTLWQAHQARMEAARAEVALDRASAVQRFLLGVFDAAQPLPGSSGIATERELADRASANLDTLLADQPQARIDLLIAIGEVYRKLGFFERSRKLL
jgi:tRNA A-37 threonylcarbamoyl transferase component Bud32